MSEEKNESIEIPLSKEAPITDGSIVKNAILDKEVAFELFRLNKGISKSEWKTMSETQKRKKGYKGVSSKVTTTGRLEQCQVHISVHAIGPLRSKGVSYKISLHKAIALVTGLLHAGNINDLRGSGKKGGKYSLDHGNENPADNRLQNLRLIRHTLNAMRQSDVYSVTPHYRKYRFGKPMFNYINSNYTKEEISDELRYEFEYVKKYTNNINDNTQYTREGAVARKRAMTLAVLAFLREKEPELFKGTAVDVSKGLLAGELKEIDMYDELVAQIKTQTKKKNAKKTKKKEYKTTQKPGTVPPPREEAYRGRSWEAAYLGPGRPAAEAAAAVGRRGLLLLRRRGGGGAGSARG